MAIYQGRAWTRAQLQQRVGHMDQLAGITPLDAADGQGRGVRLLQVHTGSGLDFDVVTDRGLDIGGCRHRGAALAWQAPAGTVHPAYYEAEGLGWLRTFGGGLLTTCGLDQFGAPAEDADERFGIHGRIGNLPAHQVGYRTGWEGDDYRLEITGKVRQARLFGENLLLERRIHTVLGASRIHVEDTITNEGYSSQPHMILYHCNLGFPLIDRETRLLLDARETAARDADAQAGLADWSTMQAPTVGYREQVFRHVPVADGEGWAQVKVLNPPLGLVLSIAIDTRTLPYVFQWKQMGQGAYVLGIEPANCSAIEGRAVARARNSLPQLEPGESRRYALVFEVEG